jgi:dienelactone hydrolase
MAIQSQRFSYEAGGIEAAAYLTWDDAVKGPLPGVLVSPTVRGPTPFEEERAGRLAALGYAAMVLDPYGIAARTAPNPDNFALMNALLQDRARLQARLGAAVDALKAREQADPARLAAIGFCFGGLCVLDLARTRTDLLGVAPFHGVFTPSPVPALERITAKVLALHGWEDPLARPADVQALADELTAKGCDWQIHAYGQTAHAFTNPAANDRQKGMSYRAEADRRSWAALTDFLQELFG